MSLMLLPLHILCTWMQAADLQRLVQETWHLSQSMPKSFPERQVALCRIMQARWPQLQEAALFTTHTLQMHPLLSGSPPAARKHVSSSPGSTDPWID